MKKLCIISVLILVSIFSFGQKVTTSKPVLPSSIVMDLKDGLDVKKKITFKIIEPKKFDSLFGKNYNDVLYNVLLVTNMQLNLQMKNTTSYKPIPTTINKVMYMDFDGKPNIVITLVAEAENGYGNKTTKEYHCYVTGNFVTFEDLDVHISKY